MIRLFKDYYDKNGIRYKVLSFNSGRYACESYHDGKCFYLRPDELFTSPPPKPAKVKFTDIIKNKEEKPEAVEIKNIISEPIYEEPVYEEPVYEEHGREEIQKTVLLKDNIKETAEDDFYADF